LRVKSLLYFIHISVKVGDLGSSLLLRRLSSQTSNTPRKPVATVAQIYRGHTHAGRSLVAPMGIIENPADPAISLIGSPLRPKLAARPPPATRRASGRCARSTAAAAGRQRAGGAPGGSRGHGAGSPRGGAPARDTAGAARWGDGLRGEKGR
jgi:hypothetical protein